MGILTGWMMDQGTYLRGDSLFAPADNLPSVEERRHQETLQAIHDSSPINQVTAQIKQHPFLFGFLAGPTIVDQVLGRK
jgi:hypothetical protein